MKRWRATAATVEEKAMNTATRMLHTWWEQNSNDLIWTALIAAGVVCTAVFVRW